MIVKDENIYRYPPGALQMKSRTKSYILIWKFITVNHWKNNDFSCLCWLEPWAQFFFIKMRISYRVCHESKFNNLFVYLPNRLLPLSQTLIALPSTVEKLKQGYPCQDPSEFPFYWKYRALLFICSAPGGYRYMFSSLTIIKSIEW